MKPFIPYSTQQINNADREAVLNALNQTLITRGQNTVKFEEDLCAVTGAAYAVAVNSATAALHAIMAYLAQDSEIEVFMSPLTFVATANSVLYTGGKVRFVDVDPNTLNIDISALEKALFTRNARARTVVVAVDYAGNPCDYEQLDRLRRSYGFTLVSDAAHSLGSFYQGVTPNYFADYTALSFHPVKSITTGEGGAVLCTRQYEAEWFRRFRSGGVQRNGELGKYDVIQLGYNYNMSDIQAALGVSQLARLTTFIYKRDQIAQQYYFKLLNAPLLLPGTTVGAKSSWHLFPVRINDFERRDAVLKKLNDQSIGANVHYIPIYEFSLYKKLGITGDCPNADKAYKSLISLPIHPAMNTESVNRVVDALRDALK